MSEIEKDNSFAKGIDFQVPDEGMMSHRDVIEAQEEASGEIKNVFDGNSEEVSC